MAIFHILAVILLVFTDSFEDFQAKRRWYNDRRWWKRGGWGAGIDEGGKEVKPKITTLVKVGGRRWGGGRVSICAQT